MGAYLYSVRTNPVSSTINGEAVPVYPLSYLTKPWGFECSTTKRLRRAADAVWERREQKGLARARYVYLSDTKGKPWDGAPVFEWDGRATCWDEPDYAGRKSTVGYLHKVGRQWRVEAVTYRVQIGRMINDTFHIRDSVQLFESRKAVAWAKDNLRVGETAKIGESRQGGKGALERVAEPSSEVTTKVTERLLHGPWPCEMGTKAEQDASNALVAKGYVNIVRDVTWTSYALNTEGLCQLAGLERKSKPGCYLSIKLTSEEVVFQGGKFGKHSIDRLSSDIARVKAHWEGYVEASTKVA